MSTQENPDCLPPPGTPDGSHHILSAEAGDGSQRETFIATWSGSLWLTSGIKGLSPRKAGWATWRYVSVVA